ncbi:EamA-like transporter family [Mycobacteroides abscessus]|nr:EamA-like transporter family [Mycobacteroides abscessus]CPS23643.1 EamA-like transporter family [Mycobacteroides abscessus]CPS26123.1 EamA-like transporter family [Mycobacteroides abscessus]CPT06158.1 EamA-like transporter family [Mycobacteroides abscessus]CPT26126.1 EamA-like transporter family [Mycobacteroides abscessus]
MATMQKTPVPMTKSSAVALTFLYALGYPIGALSVSAMTPMLVLVARFALAGAILATWALIARAVWPTGRTLCHVIVAGLLMQAVQFCALYEALEHGAPAVLGAVVISMNPVVTAVLAALFLDEHLNRWRLVALALGVVAVLTACANRLLATGGIDTVLALLLVALLGLAAGGVYQQRFCADVDFRVNSTIQNLSGLLPAGALALLTPSAVHDPWKGAAAVAAVVLLNATLCTSLYVRSVSTFGAAAVAMLFCVIPAVAGLLSWLLLGQRVDIGMGIGLVIGALACWLNARASRSTKSAVEPQSPSIEATTAAPTRERAVAS